MYTSLIYILYTWIYTYIHIYIYIWKTPLFQSANQRFLHPYLLFTCNLVPQMFFASTPGNMLWRFREVVEKPWVSSSFSFKTQSVDKISFRIVYPPLLEVKNSCPNIYPAILFFLMSKTPWISWDFRGPDTPLGWALHRRGPRSPHILESGFCQPPVLPPENWSFFVNYMFIPSIDSTVWGWKLKYRFFFIHSVPMINGFGNFDSWRLVRPASFSVG